MASEPFLWRCQNYKVTKAFTRDRRGNACAQRCVWRRAERAVSIQEVLNKERTERRDGKWNTVIFCEIPEFTDVWPLLRWPSRLLFKETLAVKLALVFSLEPLLQSTFPLPFLWKVINHHCGRTLSSVALWRLGLVIAGGCPLADGRFYKWRHCFIF